MMTFDAFPVIDWIRRQQTNISGFPLPPSQRW
jgi:hypothetical protein